MQCTGTLPKVEGIPALESNSETPESQHLLGRGGVVSDDSLCTSPEDIMCIC